MIVSAYQPSAVPLIAPPVARDSTGRRYPQWFGVNLVDMELPGVNRNPAVYGVDYQFPSDAEVFYFASKGLRLLRMDLSWEYLQPDLAGGLDAGNIGRLDHLCQTAASCGCKVLISIMNEQYYRTPDQVQHVVGGGTGAPSGTGIGKIQGVLLTDAGAGYQTAPSVSFTGGGSGVVGVAHIAGGAVTSVTMSNQGTGYTSPTVTFSGGSPSRPAAGLAIADDGVVTPAMMNAFWTLLATHYKGNPGVYAYDIMNEPSQFATWDAQAQGLINAIRTVDTTTPLIVQMTALWRTYTDSANNIIYSIHRYFDGTNVSPFGFVGFTGGPGYYHDTWETFGSYVAMGIDCAMGFITWCRSNGVRGFFGEYGIPKGVYGSSPMEFDPRYLAVLDGFLATLAGAADCIVGGTYFAAGAYYNPDYYAASYDQSQLPAGPGPYGLPDKPQMAVLQKYPTTARGAN